jgi:cyclophilin family peptidyl-prolyl cis-trans isomerase
MAGLFFRESLDSGGAPLQPAPLLKENKMQKTLTLRRSLLSRFAVFCAGAALAGAAFAADAPQVSIKTNMGEIVLELDQEKAPKSSANFLAYVKSGFYKGTIFHRVIDGFMIQAGGYDAKLQPKRTRNAIPIESKNGLSNVAYSVAMARGDNPNSATSQWFINVVDNPGLDFPGSDGHGYAVFGKVVKGQEVVDKIKGVLVDDKPGFQNVPVIPVVIESAKVVKAVK